MGKKKKSVVMTDEERLAYEEQQRLAEEEIRKKKEDILSQFLKDKLMKEEKAAQYNMTKLNLQWRSIMREAKAKELRIDIETLSQTFERLIDCKNAMIKTLFKDILESEEQYGMALRSHIQTVDYLMGLQKTQLETVNKEYALILAIICEEFDLERAKCTQQHHNEMHDIADILFAMENYCQAQENEARAEFQSATDGIKNRTLENRQALKVVLEAKIDDLWQQFRHLLQTYNETNTEQRALYETLKLKDDKTSSEIEIHMRRLARISDQIKVFKMKLSSSAKEYREKKLEVKDVDDDDEEFAKQARLGMLRHFYDLKSRRSNQREHNVTKLTKLAVESNEAINTMKKKKEKGIIMLRLAEMCRKLETEEEKVLPFYASSLTGDEELDINAVLEEPGSEIVDMMNQCHGLDKFWKRYNKVMLDRLSLEMEKQNLVDHNQNLRRLLKQYMDSISVNDEIISKANSLLIINNKVNFTSAHRSHLSNYCISGELPIPTTVIEAAHVIKNSLQ